MGWTHRGSTSQILWPECTTVHVHPELTPSLPRAGGDAGCGGDDPSFIGWPIAWVSDGKGEYGSYTFKVGWFHYSNWFDGGRYLQGGDQWETSGNWIGGTVTFNWSKWRRGARNARR